MNGPALFNRDKSGLKSLREKLIETTFKSKVLISMLALVIAALGLYTTYSYYAPVRKAEELFPEAEKAIQGKDFKLAERKLKELLKDKPGDVRAKGMLKIVEASLTRLAQDEGGVIGGASSSSGLNPGGEEKDGTDKKQDGGSIDGGASPLRDIFIGSNDNRYPSDGAGGSDPGFANVLPEVITGYVQESRTATQIEESRLYKPDKSSTEEVLIVIAMKAGNVEAAKSYIDDVIKGHYSMNTKETMINKRNAFFGIASNGLAALTWRVADVMVGIEIQADGPPEALFSRLADIAIQFP